MRMGKKISKWTKTRCVRGYMWLHRIPPHEHAFPYTGAITFAFCLYAYVKGLSMLRWQQRLAEDWIANSNTPEEMRS